MKKMLWFIGVVVNIVDVLISPGYLFADTLFMLFGRLIGIYVISFILLLPLKLFKKEALRLKLMPFLFIFLSIISLVGSAL